MSVLLFAENEHLKVVVNAKDKKLEQALETINHLENKLQTLKGKREREKSIVEIELDLMKHEKTSKNSTIV